MTQPICTIEGCEAHATVKGLCSRHYMRIRRHGDPNVVKPSGAPRNERLNAWKANLRLDNLLPNADASSMSARTFEHYCSAWRKLGRLDIEAWNEAWNEATRLNGSLNVSKFAAVTDRIIRRRGLKLRARKKKRVLSPRR
jgi:hypothetical protein